jgi:hypothetical protein
VALIQEQVNSANRTTVRLLFVSMLDYEGLPAL